jgi:hypothetical protein
VCRGRNRWKSFPQKRKRNSPKLSPMVEAVISFSTIG